MEKELLIILISHFSFRNLSGRPIHKNEK